MKPLSARWKNFLTPELTILHEDGYTEKAKPAVKQGRKATGLRSRSPGCQYACGCFSHIFFDPLPENPVETLYSGASCFHESYVSFRRRPACLSMPGLDEPTEEETRMQRGVMMVRTLKNTMWRRFTRRLMMVGICLLAVIASARSAAAADPDLVLDLPLDEAAGATTFADTSGNSNAGTCANPGCPTLGVVGKVDTAAQFDGTDDVITVADAGGLLRTNSFTISLWFQWNGLGTANVQFLTAKGQTHLELHTGGGAGVNGLRFIPAGATTILDAANALSAGWNHVAASYDGSTARVYVNGVLKGSRTGITGGEVLTADTTPFRLGRRSDASYPLSGVIDKVSVYRRVLSAAEIVNLTLDSPGAPETTAGHMPTLQELYAYLTTGATPDAAQPFQEPTTGPAAGAMKSVQQIYTAIKTLFDQITVTAADVRSGQKYFSTSPWGIQSGAMPERTNVTGGNGLLTFSLPDGYYAGKTATAADTNLTAANIKSGVTIFGQTGTFTNGATATATDMLTGKTAFVNGALVTGSVLAGNNVSGAEGARTVTIPDGLYAGSKTVTANDADLTTENIRSGVTIFGVAGKIEVVDTTTATPATAADLLTGKTAYVNGALVTGNVPAGSNVIGANGALSLTIPDGLYSGSKTATANDTNLTAANIRKGIPLFGVTGTLQPGAIAKRVAKTGQTTCYDSVGTVIACAGTGQDGEYQMGVSDYVVTPTTGPTGAYNTPAWTGVRFIDNGDGTVTDTLTALIWLKNVNCWESGNWANALSQANNLASGACGLTDGSSAGQWRLPNVNELHSLVDLAQAGYPKLPTGYPFVITYAFYHWTSTTNIPNSLPQDAFTVTFSEGEIITRDKDTTTARTWPVRGGE
jgi:hypothetical protein